MSSNVRGRLAGRKVPVLVVCGVDEAAMAATAMSLQVGLARAVGVRHTIDLERQILIRVVSDVSGVIEREEINLEHACVTCAVREDIVPTLERLAQSGRWTSIVACLPVAAEATQVCRVIAYAPRNAPHVNIAAVVTALDGSTVAEDLLGDDLLSERGIATSHEDRRGAAEVACAMVEYADLIVASEPHGVEESSLIAAVARPRVPLLDDVSTVDAERLAAGVHRHQLAEAWVADVRRGSLPPLPADGAWRMDLCSERPFDPIRFQDELAVLGAGPRRSRGCFWLPTRPNSVCVWDGAGGQASIGITRQWDRGEPPLTRIVIVGIDDARDEHARIEAAFHRCLLTDEELAARGCLWEESWDGLEPWLGPIDQVA